MMRLLKILEPTSSLRCETWKTFLREAGSMLVMVSGMMMILWQLLVNNSYVVWLWFNYILFTEGEPTYPETVRVSSTGEASERLASVMGVYKITNITHSDRPVWQSSVREDRFLFYHGNNIFYWKPMNIHLNISRWLVTMGNRWWCF